MIPFSPPRIDDAIIAEVVDTLKSGWITTGPKTKQFEREIADYCGIGHALALSSWTAGAEMLLKWFGVKAGDEVIIPAYTYCATANIIIHCGATPVMVDINDDFCLSVEALEKAITPRTKVIIPVDLGGLPCDYDALYAAIAAKSHQFDPQNDIQQQLGRILVLADAAHSFGATYGGKKIGSLADLTVFSFHAVKNLTTAEGGAICINLPQPFDNLAIYQQLNTLSLHGQSKDALAKTQKGAWEYDVVQAGFKCNMTDILASIGLIELRRYDETNLRRRKEIFQIYSNRLSETDWTILPHVLDSQRESSYHLYLLRIAGITLSERNAIIQAIFDNEVAVNVHYKPLPLLTYYAELGYDMSDYPVSERSWEQEITLPVYPDLTDEQVNKIVDAVLSSYRLVKNETSI